MAEPFPNGRFVRVIYERGLQVLRAGDAWLVPSSERLEHIANPDTFAGAMGVQHIICDTRFNVPFFQPRRMFDPSGRPVSRARYLKGYVEDAKRRIYKHMVEHHLYCAVAHLGYLAEAYAGLAVLHNKRRWELAEHVREHSQNQLFDSAIRHGEAVFTSLCSAFDTSRFLVWRDSARPPVTLAETVDAVLTAGDPEMRMLVGPIEALWYEVGPRLLEYRDCAAAHHPITAQGGRSGATLNEADIWEMRFELPDNPGMHDPARFTFDARIDMLDYCWVATCRIVRCFEETIPQIYELAVAGQEPKKWFWLSDV